MSHLIRAQDRKSGLHEILSPQAEPYRIGLNSLTLREGEQFGIVGDKEYVALLLKGKVRITLLDEEYIAERDSGFDENVCVVHLAKGTSLKISALSTCEWILIQTPNETRFASHIFDRNSIAEHEHRGKGVLEDTSHRIVRTFFDARNVDGSKLVVGEVVNFGGKWSSYPPHHHPQPEVYHYRFKDTRGYGHGEVGDDVYKIRDGDTLLIPPNLDHAQVSAPGYPMYYLWVIRESEAVPYSKPIFAAEHAWLLQ